MIYAIIAAIIFALGAGTGYKLESNSRDATELKAQNLAKEKYHEKEIDYDALSNQYEASKTAHQDQVRVVTKYVDRIVTRPVYLSDCIDDDGLRLINDAASGKPVDTSKFDAAVSKTPPAGK